MEASSSKLINIAAICCAVWFILTGWIWIYYINLLISFPVAIIGLWLWFRSKRKGTASVLTKVTIVLFAVGGILSISVLIALLTAN
jgi:hypothetical protein